MFRLQTVRQIALEVSRNLKVVENFGLAFDFGVKVIGIDIHFDAPVAFDLAHGSHALPFQFFFFGQQHVGHTGVELWNFDIEPETELKVGHTDKIN